MVSEVPSSLTSKRPLVLFHRTGSHQGRGVDLRKGERVKRGMDKKDNSGSVRLGRNEEGLVA